MRASQLTLAALVVSAAAYGTLPGGLGYNTGSGGISHPVSPEGSAQPKHGMPGSPIAAFGGPEKGEEGPGPEASGPKESNPKESDSEEPDSGEDCSESATEAPDHQEPPSKQVTTIIEAITVTTTICPPEATASICDADVTDCPTRMPPVGGEGGNLTQTPSPKNAKAECGPRTSTTTKTVVVTLDDAVYMPAPAAKTYTTPPTSNYTLASSGTGVPGGYPGTTGPKTPVPLSTPASRLPPVEPFTGAANNLKTNVVGMFATTLAGVLGLALL